MTRDQCRAARGLLGWKQSELARRAGIALKTLVDFERGQRDTHQSNLAKVEGTLTRAGIVFVSDPKQGHGVLAKALPAATARERTRKARAGRPATKAGARPPRRRNRARTP